MMGYAEEELKTSFREHIEEIVRERNKHSIEKWVKALESHHPDFLFKHIELGFASFAYQVFVDAKECTYH